MRNYTFTSKNMGDIEFAITGEYRDGTYDLQVDIEEPPAFEEFEEVDGGSVDDIFEWLIENGVEFDSLRSMWFNYHYVASVLLDGDMTEDDLLRDCENVDDDDLEAWFAKNFG